MANGPTHQLVAALTIGGVLAYDEGQRGEMTVKPLAGAAVAAVVTNLPDILEPALHPHHRQFFHSILFAGGLGKMIYELHRWKPDEEWKRAARFLGLVAGYAYLVHLAMDACTARSLPLIGKA